MSRHIVICGAGSAGCTLAARLTEDAQTSVTLLEAGPDYVDLDAMPEALAPFVTEETFPGAALVDDGAIARAVRGAPTTEAHPIGTCSMGPADSPWGVVDQRGKVHGVDGLYVIDASIMPTLPVVPTNMTTIMLAERCADLLRQSLGSTELPGRQTELVA